MIGQKLSQHGTTLVRRLVLEPGEATPWHVDPFHRVTVVVRGDALALEFREPSNTVHVEVTSGMADWDAPTDEVHRAVNVGRHTYEEVVVFFLNRPDALAQPIVD